MIKLKNISILATIVGSVNLLSSWAVFSQTEEATPEPSRWFEVEIILYKSTSEKGLTNESWATDTQMALPENIIDFLQPFGFLESVDSAESGIDTGATLEVDQGASVSPIVDDITVISASDEPLEIKEQPFIKLDDDLLQLKAEALNISRHASYNLLTHFAWRQPVLSKNKAPSLRIAGGFDYHDIFEYSGQKKLKKISGENESIDTVQNEESELVDQKDTRLNLTSEEAPQTVAEESLSQKPASLIPMALPWVPEIDGSIRVYIHRNYLHVDTNLFYRRPDKEEVDIFKLTSQLPALDTSQNTNDLSDIQDIDPQQFNDVGTSPQIIDDSSFAWEYDGDFLSNDTEKVFTERLFNYPLKQKRRLKSNQLNYFDHPLVGMLVIIRPYEINADAIKVQEEPTQTISSVNNR